MASLIHKLLKNPSSSSQTIRRFLSFLRQSSVDPPPSPLPITIKQTLAPPPPPQQQHVTITQLQFYPSFPYCFLNRDPISVLKINGLDEEIGRGEATEVWADSVKKKRKRKMNKHKYRKLRKRLRRQT